MYDLLYEEFPPHPALRAEVRCLWHARLPACGAVVPPWLRVLPDGGTDIVLDYTPAPDGGPSGTVTPRLVGMMTRPVPYAAPTASEVFGLRFNPGSASAYFRIPAHALTDRAVPLAEFWGGAAAELACRVCECGTVRERLARIEALLLRRRKAVSSGAWCAQQIARLVAVEAGQLRIGALAERTGFSRQYLARLFDEHVGIAPKLLARIERFSAIVARVEAGPRIGWAEAAAGHGYYDQAHFIHEFTEFAGVTPSAYFGRG